MSDAPIEEPSPPQNQRRIRPAQRDKKSRIIIYLIVLFAAAFLLLLLSYFMQQRANAQTISNLTKTLPSVHSLQNLVDANRQLEEANTALNEQIASLQTLTSTLTIQLEKLSQSMDYFWQLDEAYVRGRHNLCRNLIQIMEDVSIGSPLKDYLPAESTTDTDRFSPADRYQEIYAALS